MQLLDILNDEEKFETLMNKLDEDMKNRDISICSRPLEAISMISKEFKVPIIFGDTLCNKIDDWFKNLYEDKLKVKWDIGSTIVDIRGDLYSVRLPLIYGRVKVNPLQWINNITDALLKKLPKNELEEISSYIMKHYEAFQEIKIISKICEPDLKNAVDKMIEQKPEYGLSRWASLQAVEKSLKEYLARKDAKYQYTHDLNNLASEAEKKGLPLMSRKLIKDVQCGADVRYESIATHTGAASTKKQAYEAYTSAIIICEHIAKNLKIIC